MEKKLKSEEGFDYYILPNEVLDRISSGENISEEELSKYSVSKEELEGKMTEGECFVNSQYYKTCNCNGPSGPFTKSARCDVYYQQDGTNLKYCYTRCESCYVVCNG